VSYVVIEVMLALQADPLADHLVLPAPTSCYVVCRSDRQKYKYNKTQWKLTMTRQVDSTYSISRLYPCDLDYSMHMV